MVPHRDLLNDSIPNQQHDFRFRAEDNVSALNKRPNIVASHLDEHPGQVFHWKLVFSSDVDSSQQGNVTLCNRLHGVKDSWISLVLHARFLATVTIYVPALSKVAGL